MESNKLIAITFFNMYSKEIKFFKISKILLA